MACALSDDLRMRVLRHRRTACRHERQRQGSAPGVRTDPMGCPRQHRERTARRKVGIEARVSMRMKPLLPV